MSPDERTLFHSMVCVPAGVCECNPAPEPEPDPDDDQAAILYNLGLAWEAIRGLGDHYRIHHEAEAPTIPNWSALTKTQKDGFAFLALEPLSKVHMIGMIVAGVELP